MEVHFTSEQEVRLAKFAQSIGTNLEGLVKEAALRVLPSETGSSPTQPGSVVSAMRALRARVKPDPEGWTTRDYVLHGRR